MLSELSRPERAKLRTAVADGTFDLDDATATVLQNVWEFVARDPQLEPEGQWRTWYVSGGRGSGKTRTGAETLAKWIRDTIDDPAEHGDWAIVAPTFGDARDVCMESGSGLIRALGGRHSPLLGDAGWNRSHGELWLKNGARVHIDGANDGAMRVQGENLRGAWCDEVGLWRNWQTSWSESLSFAVRLAPGRIVATGTPKQGHGLVKQLLNDPRSRVTRMRLVDNLANLDPDAVDELVSRFQGTRLGRQELEGEFLEDVPGALWTTSLIEQARVTEAPDLDRVVVGVDPSGSRDEDVGTSETGIVAAGFSAHVQHGYVLADVSLHGGPERWAAKAVGLYHDLKADMIVAERNFGGEMVRATIRAADANVPVKLVNASRGKHPRAEPVALKYDQGKVHHVGVFPELEEQQTTWVPDAGMPSPDRMDALVWALTELMVTPNASTQYDAYGTDSRPVVVRRGDLRLDESAARARGISYLDK